MPPTEAERMAMELSDYSLVENSPERDLTVRAPRLWVQNHESVKRDKVTVYLLKSTVALVIS